MLTFCFSGVAIVATVLMMLARTNIRRWLGYANVVDVSFTFALFGLFHGTFSGVVSASVAGVVMSVSLQIIRKMIGCEKLQLRRVSWRKGFYELSWVYYEPKQLSMYGMKKVSQ